MVNDECNRFYFVAETRLFYVKLVREALAYFTSIITFKHCALELDIEQFFLFVSIHLKREYNAASGDEGNYNFHIIVFYSFFIYFCW